VSELFERLRYPRAGWISLVLLAVMALALAWAVQGAKWLDQMDFLVPVALYAVLFGALIGMLRGSIVWALPIGALIGTGVVLWTVGGEYYTALDQTGRLLALRTEFIDWLVVVLGTGYPPQMTPYAIGLGILMFATAFAAAFAVYRHHRVLDAIFLLGAAMIVNLSAILTDLFYQLLLFVTAALLLWLRAALVDRQDGWQRRRVNETLEVPTAIMRSGILSAGAAIALAWLLTAVAVAAPLTDAWRSMDGVWTGVRDQFDSVFGGLTNPQSRISGNSFGSSFIVQGEWVSVDDEVLVLAAPRALYLRTVTYDIYTGRGWDSSESVQRTVEAGDLLFNELTSERSTVPDAVRVERIGIEMRQPIGRDLFTAGSPLEIYAPAVVSEPFGQPLLGHIQHANALGTGESYEQDVQLSTATEAELGAAGDEYPEEIRGLYMDSSRVTDRVADLALEVTEGADNNYEKARALASYLSHDPSFSYSTKAGVPPSDADLVDFFLFDPELGRSGYCQYFASSMVMMARSLGLPARLAAGFAPGERQDDDTFLYREANAHAWAEIYFPGYGWEIFEATKSINPGFGRATGDATTPGVPPTVGIDPFLEDPDLVDSLRGTGGEVALPSPDPVEGAIDPSQPDAAATDEASRGANALLIAVLVLGGLIALWVRMNYVNRRWRLLPAGDRAWRQLTAAAGRAGVGPRPSETIYEYAGWLEDQLPDQAVPIQTVADGKVWQSYSGRGLTLSGAHKLENALRQLRWPLIWLAVRRWAHRFTRRDGSD
jgi:transglutaminase-like putative cysteine protease